jgi:hypothetical protein
MIIKRLKASGKESRPGETITEIATTEATMTYDADAAGFVQVIEGESEPLAIGSAIAHLLDSTKAAGAAVAAGTPGAGGVATEDAGEPVGNESVRTADPGVMLAQAEPASAVNEGAARTRAPVVKVRDGRVTPPELAGGTFTVSNLRTFGVPRFTAVIDPPPATIFAVGIANPPAAVGPDGPESARRAMELTPPTARQILDDADDLLTTVRDRLRASVRLCREGRTGD